MPETGERERAARAPRSPAPRPISRRAQAALPLSIVSAGMLARWVRVAPRDVVYVKGLFEASDGLASIFAERGGDLLIAAPPGRDAELFELLADIEREIGASVAEPSLDPPLDPLREGGQER